MKIIAGVLLIWVVISLFFVACSKGAAPGEEDPNHIIDLSDTTYPVIQINTPTDNQVFNSGASISITGKITDNSLFRGVIRIKNDADNATVKEQEYEIHGLPSYNFSLSHTVQVTKASDYTVTVEFEDHGYNTTTKSVKVKVNP